MDISEAYNIRKILDVSVEFFTNVCGVSLDKLLDKSHDSEVALYRHMIWTQMYEYSGKSTAKIGALFNRNHATVLYGVKKIKSVMSHPAWISEKMLYERYCKFLWSDSTDGKQENN